MSEIETKAPLKKNITERDKFAIELFSKSLPSMSTKSNGNAFNAYYFTETDFYQKMATKEGRSKRDNIQASTYDVHFGNLYMSDSALFIASMFLADLISIILWFVGVENAFLGMLAFTTFGVMALTETETMDFVKGKPLKALKGQLMLNSKGDIVPKENSELKSFMDAVGYSNVTVISKITNQKYEMMLRPDVIYSKRRHYNENEHNGLVFSGTIIVDAYLHIKEKLPLALAVATNPDSPEDAIYDAERSIKQLTGAYIGQVIIDVVDGSEEERERKATETSLLKEQLKVEREQANQPTDFSEIEL